MRAVFAAAVLWALSGCIDDRLARCGDVTCPLGSVCLANACATNEQVAACASKEEGQPCGAVAVIGFCVGGACRPSFCGNTVVQYGEVCDDGNEVSGDGCSESCDSNETCGNATIDLVMLEECDDGNTVNGDGCDNNCTATGCGNGIVTTGESCDDGNTVNGDGCDNNCRPTGCGDGIKSGTEQCDDGNTINTDACTNGCRIAICGDNILHAGSEQCDDGNTITESTCPYGTATCSICSATCTIVTAHGNVCGDRVVDPIFEDCDDGNNIACGTCDQTCRNITSKRATGYIVAVSGAAGSLVDGETFTLTDGRHPAVVFELDSNMAVTAPHIAIPFTALSTADALATAIASSINAQLFDVSASQVAGDVVGVSDDLPTSLGNVSIMETVTNPDFVTIGMSGGDGGNCANGVGCKSPDDCASHKCSTSFLCAP